MLALVSTGCSSKPNTVKRNSSAVQTPAPTNTTIRTNDNLTTNPSGSQPTESSKPSAQQPQETLAPGQTPRSNSATAVSRKEAINDFKVRPLYESTTLAKSMNSTWYASAKKYPETGSYLNTFYGPKDKPPAKTPSEERAQFPDGAVLIEHNLLSAKDYGPCPYKTVKTRDHDACTVERRENATPEQRADGVYGGNVTERTLAWFQKVDEGYLFVQLRVYPDRYSLEQLVALTDDLAVIR
jgi:hypothetical protein